MGGRPPCVRGRRLRHRPGRKLSGCDLPRCSQVPQDMEIRIVGPFDPHRYTPGCSAGMEFRPYRNEHVHLTDDANTDEQMQHLVRELSNILLPQCVNWQTMCRGSPPRIPNGRWPTSGWGNATISAILSTTASPCAPGAAAMSLWSASPSTAAPVTDSSAAAGCIIPAF